MEISCQANSLVLVDSISGLECTHLMLGAVEWGGAGCRK
jgi:hypothetical protein